MSVHQQLSSPTRAAPAYFKQNGVSNADSTVIGAVSAKNGSSQLPTSSPGSKHEFSSTIIESEANHMDSSKILGAEDEFGMPPVFDMKDDHDDNSKYNLSSEDISSQQLHSHAIDPQEFSDDSIAEESTNKKTTSLKVLTLPVMTYEQSKTVTIGRSSKINDFQLTPKSGLISRQHLAVTYFPNTNSLRIKCYGKNGVVVNFPKELKYKLVRQLKEKIFELVPKKDDSDDADEKEIVSSKGITSFVLNEKEICFIPYMTGLQLSFGVVSVEIVIKHVVGEDDDADKESKSSYLSQEKTVAKNGNIPSSPLAAVVDYDESDKREITTENLHAKLLAEEKIINKTQEQKSNKRQHEDHLQTKSSPSSAFKKQKTVTPKSELLITKREALENLMDKLKNLNISIKELVHTLTNHIAFAPVQQIPLRQLYESNNTVSKNLKLPEFKTFTENLLLNIEPSIQIIHRQGKDAAGKLLDPEFFYDVEKDTNEERVLIVGSLKGGRSGLRSCRKTHKQYFWKKPTK